MEAVEALFARAAHGDGLEYWRCERALREAGERARPVLQAHAADADPMVRLLCHVLLERLEGRHAFGAANYLEGLPARFAESMFEAEAAPAAAFLTLHFEARAVELLALHLVKGTHFTIWRIRAMLLYLRRHRAVSSTEALLRFAVETAEPELRREAMEVVKAIGDPDLAAKLAVEERRLGRPLPISG